MYSAGPLGPTGKRKAELIGELFLVGTRGKCCAVLTEHQLTIERYDGRGIRLGLGAIDRMRHLKAPILPSGTTLLGLLAIYLGITTIVSPWKWMAIVIGIFCLIANAVSRYSILAIETSNGDRHLISGNEGSLLKLCLMVDRVRHGSTIEEATIGLESLETELPFFPALSDAKGSLKNIGNIAVATMENKEVDFSPASNGLIFGQKPQNDPVDLFGYGSEEVVNNISKTIEEEACIPSHSDEGNPKLSAYERAWGGRQAPPWYSEKSLESEREDRMGSALSDAAQGLDLFANGGLFDTEYSDKETEQGGIGDWTGDFRGQNIEETRLLAQSSSQMIKMAHDKFGAPERPYSRAILPPPTEEAVREECRAGVVKQARARQELQVKMQNNNNSRSTNLEEYPALNKLASTMGSSRIDTSNTSGSDETGSWLGRLLRPSHDSGKKARLGNRSKIEERTTFQTAQHMRLRSDQEHQAEVGSRIRSMGEVNSGGSAKDTLDIIVGRMSRGEEAVPRMLDSPGDALSFSQLKATSSNEDPHPIPGLRRLG